MYIDGLIQLLSKNGVGCTMGDIFCGILVYADDIVLLAPSANAMRCMLRSCDEYATNFNIVFNAGKSKCLYVQGRPVMGKITL